MQCKFSDKGAYNDLVKEEHIDKNMALVKAWNKKHKSDLLRCVTVFMVGAPVKNIPVGSRIEDDVIIIHSENLELFLGPFAHFHILVAALGFLRVNELSTRELGHALAVIFKEGKPKLADAIVKVRTKSFKDIEDLVRRLDAHNEELKSNGEGMHHFTSYIDTLRTAGNKIIF